MLCNEIARCHSIDLAEFNPDFIKYLLTIINIDIQSLDEKHIKFCCAIDYTILQQIISSGTNKLRKFFVNFIFNF